MKFELNLYELDTLIKTLPNDGIILLRGTLASGKTTLVKAIAKFYNVNENVSSPTFSQMQVYNGDIKIYHYDIYQKGANGILANGLIENFYEDGLHIVEWGDKELEKILKKMALDFCKIDINFCGDKRIYEVSCA
ncbi:MAG: tRNA (adenosine(37)-N6)-threonylcarbamoyltransferase complex ATPase subunit type 1 TsaE [Campylobacter sp.]|nr:tRNA (adenosine(37)-N6)-threonylcarbamoyltransferase complex ATPase subunit type 1 TsaE [Campylobacter sp.]